MSCNLISGMFQRLDRLRKNAFSSVILFGEDNNSTISGVWVWRGQELVFPVSTNPWIPYQPVLIHLPFHYHSLPMIGLSITHPTTGRNWTLRIPRPRPLWRSTFRGRVTLMAKSSTKARSSNKPKSMWLLNVFIYPVSPMYLKINQLTYKTHLLTITHRTKWL